MDFLPWTFFARSVIRYGGDRRVRNLSCTEQFRAIKFWLLMRCSTLVEQAAEKGNFGKIG